MKNIALLFSKSAFTRITVYQYVVIFGCVVAMALALAVPIYFAEPDDWTYYYAVQNFARGQFTIDNQTHLLQLNEVRSRGGQAIQYWNIGNNRWALEKAPGFVFYMVPFKLAGIPRGGNVLLALGTVFVTFILVRRLFDEKAAMIGALLMLFTPMSLIMLNRAYMDTYASQAFLTMGGGLYLYYHLEQSRWRPMKRGILLFLSFFLAGWSVVTRYTNLPVAAILVLHFVVVKAIAWRRGDKPGIGADILPAIAGIALPVIAILLYDYFVFGSPFSYGYQYSRSEIKFAFQYLGQVNQSGQSVPLKIIWDNLKAAPRP
ncbi:MAG TPA: glycosyltransferase family 39 protein, partial [Dehalococcoidales bacterium]|nr:glycosyltransferase family 39 protein [Dehalococcoidales bacterium]